MQINEEDIKTIKSLIEDFGFEYGLKTKEEEVIKLARKIGMTEEFIKHNFNEETE